MPEWKKFKFKIVGRRNDQELRPLTMPMARLADYLSNLAAVLGYKDDVHLMGVDDGSTQPIIWIDASALKAVLAHGAAAKSGRGSREANDGYRKLNEKLREDDGSADLIDAETEAPVFEVPGKKGNKVAPVGAIREQASVAGQLRNIGGIDESIHLALLRADGSIIRVETDEQFAKRLEQEGKLFTNIRLHGMATWKRDETGKWKLERFKAQSYDTEPLIDEPISATLEKLRAIPGNQWNEMEDPFEELDRLRNGDDEPTQ